MTTSEEREHGDSQDHLDWLDHGLKLRRMVSKYDDQRATPPPSRTPTGTVTETANNPTKRKGHWPGWLSLSSWTSLWRGKPPVTSRRPSNISNKGSKIERKTEESTTTSDGHSTEIEPGPGEGKPSSMVLEKTHTPPGRGPTALEEGLAGTDAQGGPGDEEFTTVSYDERMDPNCGNPNYHASENKPSSQKSSIQFVDIKPLRIHERQQKSIYGMPSANTSTVASEESGQPVVNDVVATKSDPEMQANHSGSPDFFNLSSMNDTQQTIKGITELVDLEKKLCRVALLANQAASESGYFSQPAIPYASLDFTYTHVSEKSEGSAYSSSASNPRHQHSSRTSPIHDHPKESLAQDAEYYGTNELLFKHPRARSTSASHSPPNRKRRSSQTDISSSPSRDGAGLHDAFDDELAAGISDVDFFTICIGDQFLDTDDKANGEKGRLDDADQDDIQLVEKRKRDLAPVMTLSTLLGSEQATALDGLLDPDIPSRSLGHSIAYWMLQGFVRSWLELSRFNFSDVTELMERLSSLLGPIHFESLIFANWFCDGTFAASNRPKSTGQRRIVSSIRPSISSTSDDVPYAFQQYWLHGSDPDSEGAAVYQITRRFTSSESPHSGPSPIRASRSGYSSHRHSFSSSASKFSQRSTIQPDSFADPHKQSEHSSPIQQSELD